MARDWLTTQHPSGADYDRLLATRLEGRNPHGEADFVEQTAARFFPRDASLALLDAGCGTGRIAIELARRGFDVTGVDIDPAMLNLARAKSANVDWLSGDLASVQLPGRFSIILMAGNVMIFVGPGKEDAVLRNLAAHLSPGGILIAGFQLKPGGFSLQEYDRLAAAAGLRPAERYGTWHRDALPDDPTYAVSLHRIQDHSA